PAVPSHVLLRRGRGDRPALPPPGRDRYALLYDRRLSGPGGPHGHRAGPRRDDADSSAHGRACGLALRAHSVERAGSERGVRRVSSRPVLVARYALHSWLGTETGRTRLS